MSLSPGRDSRRLVLKPEATKLVYSYGLFGSMVIGILVIGFAQQFWSTVGKAAPVIVLVAFFGTMPFGIAMRTRIVADDQRVEVAGWLTRSRSVPREAVSKVTVGNMYVALEGPDCKSALTFHRRAWSNGQVAELADVLDVPLERRRGL